VASNLGRTRSTHPRRSCASNSIAWTSHKSLRVRREGLWYMNSWS
jgi:hypothetical protein